MREGLKSFDWHIYGLSEGDISYTLNLISGIIKDQIDRVPKSVDGCVGYDAEGNKLQDAEIANEVIADFQYYTWLDGLFICQFGLWRLQGIFEGIVKQDFFPTLKFNGIKSILDKLRKSNYVIADSDYQELLEWAKHRNALSHFPPEQFRPSGLNESDLKEYSELILRIISELKTQKSKLALSL